MKKNSLFKIFIFGFLKSFLIIALLIGVGYGSYSITKMFYSITDTPTDTIADTIIKDIVSDVQTDKISRNLIYSVNAKSGEITDMVLEIFNSNTGNLDYITVPANTQFTLSNDMYQRIFAVNPESPQIIKLSELYRYFSEETRYDYGVLLLEDHLGIDISYYTTMKKKVFESIFEKRTELIQYTEQGERTLEMAESGEGSDMITEEVDICVFTEDMQNQIQKITTVEEIDQYLDKLYDEIGSNLPLKSKKKYFEAYLNINPDFIYYHCLYGKKDYQKYIVDTAASRDLIENIIGNKAYNIAQNDNTSAEGISSVGHKIEILNGSRVTGLAASFKDELTADGFTVARVGNYSGQSLEQTKIIVNTPGLGRDLIKYFNEPVIETQTLPEGIDIQIILGKGDA